MLLDRAIDVLTSRHGLDLAGQVLGVKREPLRGHHAGALAQSLEAGLLLGALAQGDHVADLHGVGRDVHLLAVDQDVAMKCFGSQDILRKQSQEVLSAPPHFLHAQQYQLA